MTQILNETNSAKKNQQFTYSEVHMDILVDEDLDRQEVCTATVLEEDIVHMDHKDKVEDNQ